MIAVKSDSLIRQLPQPDLTQDEHLHASVGEVYELRAIGTGCGSRSIAPRAIATRPVASSQPAPTCR
jgi:hypothetical protein